MKVLVTGGAGYIGSHTCKLLSSKGHQPFVYDNLVRGHREFVKWGKFCEGSLQDTQALKEFIQSNQIDAVIHFAAYAYVGESMQNPFMYYENNVLGTLSLLKVLRECQINKIIFSSTCSTYGVPEHLPITEDTPQNPINPYGQSKLLIEKVLKDMASQNQMRAVCLRYFNAAGADPESEIGEKHDPETHLIPLVIESAITGKQIQVFGDDYETPDGTCIRDYIHVTDLAEAHILALSYLTHSKINFDYFNLGTNNGLSVLEIIKAVEATTGKKVNYQINKRRPGDPPSLVASNKKAKEILKWTPQYSDIKDIIKTAYQWHTK